jgi:PAS domain S-box-containing protein
MPSGSPQSASFENDVDRFHLLVDAVTDYAIYLLDRDGRVASWNVGAERLKGYSAAEAIGQPYWRFFSEEDQRRNLPARLLAEAREKGRLEIEGWRVRKDRSRFFAFAVIHKIVDERGRHIGFAKVTRDITERKQAQEALFESERRFRLLVEGLTDYAICMLDPSGIVANWNTGAARMKGYTADEIISQHFSRFYPPEDRTAGLPARALRIAAEEGRYEAEGWRMRKDGTRFWAAVVIDAIRDPDGTLIGFAKITRDVTERRAAQEELKASERLFRLLVNGVTDYALFMLDPNGIVTSWNAGAERIKGYAAPEIIGQHFSRFYTATDRAAGVPARALQTAAAEGRFEAEGWRLRKDGKPFWANVVIDPIRDDDGRLIGYSKITRDITERRQAQQSMQEAQTRMAQLQKMEALGQLTGGVAHDFNNMLMVISGFVPRLKEAAAHDPRAVRAADAIELAVQRSAALTRQLLSFSRRQSLRPAVVRLAEAIEAARPIIASLLGSSVEYVTAVLPETWPVLVDASELELAIINLSVNARDAMPGGGTIAITADNVRLAGEVGDLKGEFVALTLADTGEGMPPDILARAFDPFFTTKEEGKGTGLGLSQVHGFVHQSGGSVVIKSDVGQGTRVTLYLPRATGETAAAMPADAPDSLPRGCSVLLVEDNPDVAEVTRDLLERMGCRAAIVRDADTALQRLGEKGFDIVLSDIVMAGPMNGLGLARLVRERWPRVRVVLATGYSEAAAEAAKDFIVLRKPYKVEDLDWAFAQPIPAARANIVAFQDTRHGRRSDRPRPGDT